MHNTGNERYLFAPFNFAFSFNSEKIVKQWAHKHYSMMV